MNNWLSAFWVGYRTSMGFWYIRYFHVEFKSCHAQFRILCGFPVFSLLSLAVSQREGGDAHPGMFWQDRTLRLVCLVILASSLNKNCLHTFNFSSWAVTCHCSFCSSPPFAFENRIGIFNSCWSCSLCF